jgi:hypothetical protein
MTGREGAGRLSSQKPMFYEEEIQKLVPLMINALIMLETM